MDTFGTSKKGKVNILQGMKGEQKDLRIISKWISILCPMDSCYQKQYLQENGYKGNSHAMRITNIVHLYRMKILNLKKNEGKEKKKKIRYLLPWNMSKTKRITYGNGSLPLEKKRWSTKFRKLKLRMTN